VGDEGRWSINACDRAMRFVVVMIWSYEGDRDLWDEVSVSESEVSESVLM